MSGKTLALLGGALTAIVLAYFVAQSRAPATDVASEDTLFPGLSAGINAVDSVAISGAGDQVKVTLARGEQAWTVVERGGYRADPAMVRKLLIDLADAKLIERKTSRAENYATLGVEDTASEAASGIKITLGGLGDNAAVILGGSARANTAMYVRRASEEASWVANKRLRIEQTPAAWLVKDLIDVNASRVTRVTITHADGEVVEAVRGAVNFEVANLPQGKALSGPAVANALADVFDDLKFDDVIPSAEFDADDAPFTNVTYLTSDGLKIDAATTAANGKYYVRMMTMPIRVDPATFATQDSPPNEPSPEEKSAAMFEAMQAQSADINARVGGWVFAIPLFKYEQLTRRIADLIGESDVGPS